MKTKYINPYTDFGFKKIFGEEASKPLLLDFLNAFLPESGKIVDLTFKNSELHGDTNKNWNLGYDIYCKNEKGEKIIVELQKAEQNFFGKRNTYYASFPIIEQGEKGDWDFNLKAVYCIGILDFTFDNAKSDMDKGEYEHTIKLKNQNGKTFYEKLTFIYFEMPNFKKTEEELETRLDQWLYFIKHLEDFQVIPNIIADEVFQRAFEKAELAKLDPKEMEEYERSLKVFRDLNGAFTTAHDDGKVEGIIEGKIEGKAEGKIEIASFMKAENESIEKIIKYTGLTMEELEKL
jgi:predicted transposase/invertase (TIGR01784 family)